MVSGGDGLGWNSAVPFDVGMSMTDTQRKRDPRYTRTVGEKPHQGRRYVENGKVRIEWFEDGKRRTRTIGDNDAETRHRADEELERLLGLEESERGTADEEERHEGAPKGEEEWQGPDLSWLLDEARGHAEALMDFADELAESFEKLLMKVLDAIRRPEAEDEAGDDADAVDAEVVEEILDTDEPEKS